MEVEKKFVVTWPGKLEDFLEHLGGYYTREIFDVYDGSLRYRFSDDSIAITHKTGIGVVRDENELFFDTRLNDIANIRDFFTRILGPQTTGKKTRYDFWPNQGLGREVPYHSIFECVHITFDDYLKREENIVLIMEIESLNNEFPLQEQISCIDEAFRQLKRFLPELIAYRDVTGIPEYSNRSLIVDPSILKNDIRTCSICGLPDKES